MEGKIIRTHTKAWDVEKRIYSVGDFNLPRSLALDSLGFALIGIILAALLSHIPVIGTSSPVLLYGGLGVGLPILMKKLKIHSKTPARFLMGYASFLLQPKSMARFQPVTEKRPIRFTNVNYRR